MGREEGNSKIKQTKKVMEKVNDIENLELESERRLALSKA